MEKPIYRYERKFIADYHTKRDVETIIRLNSALFTEIYYPRYVNNIYFDDNNFSFYSQNYDGIRDRIKYRIRWYGKLNANIEKPVLELKIKRGMLGYKKRFQLRSLLLGENNIFETIQSSIVNSNLPDEVKFRLSFLKPVLINRYQRKYFQSIINPEYRLTLDSELRFMSPGFNECHNTNSTLWYGDPIIELKYDQHLDKHISSITNDFDFRLSRFSKYVVGIKTLYK
jgi:SPX domain protein involved in polyphosphate accumulation